MMRYFDLQMVKRINGKRQVLYTCHLAAISTTLCKSQIHIHLAANGVEKQASLHYTISNKNDGYDALF